MAERSASFRVGRFSFSSKVFLANSDQMKVGAEMKGICIFTALAAFLATTPTEAQTIRYYKDQRDDQEYIDVECEPMPRPKKCHGQIYTSAQVDQLSRQQDARIASLQSSQEAILRTINAPAEGTAAALRNELDALREEVQLLRIQLNEMRKLNTQGE